MQVIQAQLKGKANWVPLNKSKVKFIIVHHIQAASATPEQIDSCHLANGWSGGFGYNEYVRKDGTVYIGRGMNIGAQCAGLNSSSYGISVEGDYSKEQKMPIAQLTSLVERINWNKQFFPQDCTVVLHRDKYNTECPGQFFPVKEMYELLDKNKRDVELEEATQLLKDNLIINSPDYWNQCKDKNFPVKAEYVRDLIMKMKDYIMIVNNRNV